MKPAEKKTALREWHTVLNEHPKLARAMLAQQAILIEAAEMGEFWIEDKMCIFPAEALCR